jgi:hypothetical protein
VKVPTSRWMAAAGGLLVAVAAVAPLVRAQQAVLVEEAAVEQSGEAKPLAVVAFSGYDELMQDVDFIGSLAGQQQASDQIKGLINLLTQQKGLQGLDTTKPIGAVLQSDGTTFGGALCIPVTDLNALLEVAKGFQVTSQDAGNGLLQIMGPGGQGAFAKNENGWAMLSLAPQMLEGLPNDPGQLFAQLTDQYDVAVQVNVQNVPQAYREMAVGAMSQGAMQGMIKKDDESDEEYAVRKGQVETQLTELKRFFSELDQFTVGVAVDDAAKNAIIDIGYTAVPGTQLAEQIAAQSAATTNFAGFAQPDAAATLSFASKMEGANAAQMDQMIEQLRTQAAKAIDEEADLENEASKETLKAAFNDFIDAIKATLEAGVADGGAMLLTAPDALTFVAGGYIADPAKVESGLKKIAEVGKTEEKDMPEVKWASETHGDITFHTMAIPNENNDEAAKQLFGETVDLAVGVGKDSVYFAVGRDAVGTIKKVVDASASSPAKDIPPVELKVALGQIMNMVKSLPEMSPEDQQQAAAVAEMLNTEAAGKDHVSIKAEPIENGVKMRIEAEEGVLKAIGTAAKMN